VIFQPPRTCDGNILDLGLWVSMQSGVEKGISRDDLREKPTVIYNKLSEVFYSMDQAIIDKVHDRLTNKVWHLIVADGGGNQLVETNRGKLTADPVVEMNVNNSAIANP